MKFFKKTLTFLTFLFLIWLIAFNIRLYYQPTYNQDQVNQDVLNHLHYLKEELHNGAAHKMQLLFPEGHLFLNSLYGLTWLEVAGALSPEKPTYREAMAEVDLSLIHI